MQAILARLQAYLEPLILLGFSLIFFPITLLFHPLLFITSYPSFRSKWFAAFWRRLGPKMAASPEQHGFIDELLTRAHGTVLEIGPGSGDQMYHLKPVASRISRIYGAEPNVELHAGLLQKAADAGLKAKYTALAAGAEPNQLLPALKRAGVLHASASNLPPDGVFDTIITIKSMCSASQAEMASIVAVIQALLKPGGEFLFFEHVANTTDPLTSVYVWLLNWIWPLAMGGCRLDGKLDRTVLGMSGWSETDVHTTSQFQGYNVFRYVIGIVKKK